MNINHTPGPWENFGFADGLHFISTSDGEPIAFGECPIYDRDYLTIAQSYANAKLIAAAPDLLEALIIAVKVEERHRSVMIDANREMGFDEPKKPRWVSVAELAILKATQP